MAWSTPLTAVTNATLTATQWNASVRDNLNETAAAKATTAGWHFASTGTNAIAERRVAENEVDAQDTTTSTTFTNIGTNGPILSSVVTGVQALVMISAELWNSGAGQPSYASFEVTGATTSISNDQRAIRAEAGTNQFRFGTTTLVPLTVGTNTFRMQYRVAAGTGTWRRRRMVVMAL